MSPTTSAPTSPQMKRNASSNELQSHDTPSNTPMSPVATEKSEKVEQPIISTPVPSSPKLELIDAAPMGAPSPAHKPFIDVAELERLRFLNAQVMQRIQDQDKQMREIVATKEQDQKVISELQNKVEELKKSTEEDKINQASQLIENQKLAAEVDRLQRELSNKTSQFDTLTNEMTHLENRLQQQSSVIEHLQHEKTIILLELQKRMDKVFESTSEQFTHEANISKPHTPDTDEQFLYYWSKS